MIVICSNGALHVQKRFLAEKKISGNQKADERNVEILLVQGWRVALIWECSIKGKSKRKIKDVIETCSKWLRSSKQTLQIRDMA